MNHVLRRLLCFCAPLGAIGLLAALHGTALGESTDRVNVMWLIAEDLSPDLSCYGVEEVATPNLDRLAADGMRFTHMFTTSGVCSPSRTALAVGCMQTSVGAFHMRYTNPIRPALPDGVQTIAELMQDAGYTSANIAMRGEHPEGKGKDDWMFQRRERSQWQLKAWEELKQHQPFYGQINFRLTHRPWERDSHRPIDPATVKLPPYYPDTQVVREDWAAYLESLQVLDSQVGRVLALLEADGLDKNTVVFFMGDHGRPFTRAKYWCYDSGLRVPFLVRWPDGMAKPRGHEEGAVSDQLLSSIDLTATTLALSGTARPDWMEGRIFLGDHQDAPREAVFAAADRIGELEFQTRSIRTRRFRYVRNELHGFSINEASTAHRKGNHPLYHVLRRCDAEGRLNAAQRTVVDPLPPEQLFDIDADPFEIRNLAEDPAHADTLAELRRQLDAWIEVSGDQGRLPDSPEVIAAFEEYGRQSRKRYAAGYEQLRKRAEAE